jgi:hypothetical protein
MLELRLRERLSGALVLPADPGRELLVELELELGAKLAQMFRGTLALDIDGLVAAPPLARRARATGAGAFDRRRGTLAYELAFRGDRGERYRLALRRALERANLYTSLTVLAGEITGEDGALAARCRVRFDVRSDLRPLLRSARLRF